MNNKMLLPGRNLDALIAEKVMQFNIDPRDVCLCGLKFCEIHGVYPHYSTDIATAWQVVEKLWAIRGRDFQNLEVARDLVIGWTCRLAPGPGTCDPFVFAMGDTAPHAICIAALKTVK